MSLFNLTHLHWVWHRLNIEILLKYCNSSGEIMEWNYFKISWRREDWSWPYFLFWLQSALRNVWKIYNLAGPGNRELGRRSTFPFLSDVINYVYGSKNVPWDVLKMYENTCPQKCDNSFHVFTSPGCDVVF